MTRLKKFGISSPFSKNNTKSKKYTESLNRLSEDSYELALSKLKNSLAYAHEKERFSKLELTMARKEYSKIRTLRNKVDDGYYLNDLEAEMVGLLKIS